MQTLLDGAQPLHARIQAHDGHRIARLVLNNGSLTHLSLYPLTRFSPPPSLLDYMYASVKNCNADLIPWGLHPIVFNLI